jgi:hypothetical protein
MRMSQAVLEKMRVMGLSVMATNVRGDALQCTAELAMGKR